MPGRTHKQLKRYLAIYKIYLWLLLVETFDFKRKEVEIAHIVSNFIPFY